MKEGYYDPIAIFQPPYRLHLKDRNGVWLKEGDKVKVRIKGRKAEYEGDLTYFPEYGCFGILEKGDRKRCHPLGHQGSSTPYTPYTFKSFRWIEKVD